MRRTRYRFIGRDGWGNYVWESTLPIPGDSRHEQITIQPSWFWARSRPAWCSYVKEQKEEPS